MSKCPRFTAKEDAYIINNYLSKTRKEIAEQLGRSEKSTDSRIQLLIRNNVISTKRNFANNSFDSELESYGRKNKGRINWIKQQIELNKEVTIKRQEAKYEEMKLLKGKVIQVSSEFFLVQGGNYKESIKYIDILNGFVKVVEI